MKNKSKLTLKIALIEFLVFVIAFVSIWGYYLVLEHNIERHKDAAYAAGYLEYHSGEIEEYQEINLYNKDYIALEVTYHGWFGSSNSEYYLIDADTPSIKKFDLGDDVVVLYKELPPEMDPENYYENPYEYPITNVHSICKGTNNYGDFLLIALFLGIPTALVIVGITLLIALILFLVEKNKKKKEIITTNNTPQENQDDYQNYL